MCELVGAAASAEECVMERVQSFRTTFTSKRSVRPSWHIVTGENPPAPGGVSDYTRNLACALAKCGDQVHVWAPGRTIFSDPGVSVHFLRGGFSPAGLRVLGQELDAQPAPRRILVQYVPQAFGFRGMNLPLCAWLAACREDIWIMFHEVAVRLAQDAPLRRNALAAVTQAMAALLAWRANRLFVSVPRWEDFLRSFFPWAGSAVWLPIPSNLPTEIAPAARQAARVTLGVPPEAPLVGHFGTYGLVAMTLAPALAAILARDPRRFLVLLGRGAGRFVDAALHPLGVDARRLLVTGELSAEEVAAHLAACSLVLQPYPDGISGRRTSVMASLALGVPVVTNEGPQTEAVWRASGAVAIAAPDTAEALALAAGALLGDEARRSSLGARGRELYEQEFSMARTVATLRSFDL